MLLQQLYTWCFTLRKRLESSQKKGFTLIELLVSIIIVSIIMVSLLYLVVEMMQLNRRETVLTEVQQDMDRALDYINRDAQEAVFVYTEASQVTPQLTDLPDGTPILAFWRVDPVDVSVLKKDSDGKIDCTQYTETEKQEACKVLRLRHSSYTLVVYLQTLNDDPTPPQIWNGASRIIRYELSQYSDIEELTERDGYRDPAEVLDGFGAWTSTGDTKGFSAVLVDHIDAPDTTLPSNYVLEGCPESDVDGDGTIAPGESAYTRTPNDASTGNSFFVCAVSGQITPTANNESAQNQDLVIYLRGDAVNDGRSGFGTSLLSDTTKLPTVKSQVFVRGVIN